MIHEHLRKLSAMAVILLLAGAAACGPAPEEAPDAGAGEDTSAVEEPAGETAGEGMEEAYPGDEQAVEVEAPAEEEPMAEDAPTMPVIGETVTTDSGLQYEDVVVGTGAEATPGNDVVVNYSGFLEDGTMFDSSIGREPFGFSLGAGQVIPGWDEGVAGMLEGGRRTLIIPAELGYGAAGAGNVIPGGATLIFDVELLQVVQ